MPLFIYFFLLKFLRGSLEDHYRSIVHQGAIVCCVEQIWKQFAEPYHTDATAATNMQMERCDLSYKATTTTGATEKISDVLKNLHSVIDLLASGIHTLNDELSTLNSGSLPQSQSLETTDKLLSKSKMSVDESNSVLTAMHSNISILQQDLSILKQNYEDRQITSYDGTLIWKITGFQAKMSKNNPCCSLLQTNQERFPLELQPLPNDEKSLNDTVN